MNSPTLIANPAVRNFFHSDQRRYLHNTPATNKLLILDNFNAGARMDSLALKGVVGWHGDGNCFDNWHLLLYFCTDYKLAITNVNFQQIYHLKTTCMHHFDYVPMTLRYPKDVFHTREMPRVECSSDQRHVRCWLKLQFTPRNKKGGNLNVSSLRREEINVTNRSAAKN